MFKIINVLNLVVLYLSMADARVVQSIISDNIKAEGMNFTF